MLDEKKISRLTLIARLYYEECKSQYEIAKIIGVSRPMISKLLAEAREIGIVKITISELKSKNQTLSENLIDAFGLKDAYMFDCNIHDFATYKSEIYKITQKLLSKSNEINLGIGCGSSLGMISEAFEDSSDKLKNSLLKGNISPLIGGFKATFRSYHTNELVRNLSENLGLKANYLYLPAMLSSNDEKELYIKSDSYMQIRTLWQELDVALINISPLYAPPDLATSLRFGKRLQIEKAVGRFLVYYYDIEGNFIEPNADNIIQIELAELKKIKNVVAICSNSVDPESVIGALRTNCFSSIILSSNLAEKIINLL